MRITRRQLFGGAIGSLLLGCGDDDTALSPAPLPCDDRFAGGALLGLVPFTKESVVFDTPTGTGLNGRLYTDLSKLAPDRLVVPNETHYIRTRYPDLLDPSATWTIAVGGLVKKTVALGLDALAPRVKRSLGPFVLECSGNARSAGFGLMSAARWSGVPIDDVLSLVEVLPAATRVLVSGFDSYAQPQPGISTPGASWIFSFEDLRRAGAFLATEMNDVPLPLDHGFPVRLFVPGWYGCTCIKWVNEITLVDESAAATSQMQEFASRTHQDGVPALARDFAPATLDQAAMPVRIERWRVGGAIVHRVIGIMWGGDRQTDKLAIRFGDESAPWAPVDRCYAQTTNQTWTLWSHAWTPRPGSYAIRLRVDDPSIRTRRLDRGYYERSVDIADA